MTKVPRHEMKTVEETIEAFKKLGHKDFDSCYAYAVFPVIGRAAFGVGVKFGSGDVFVGGPKAGTVMS